MPSARFGSRFHPFSMNISLNRIRFSPGPRAFAVAALLFVLCAPRILLAATGDCSQPVSGGENPVASDCLFILTVAVGAEVCDPVCICAPTGSLPPTATDALLCLQNVVGVPVQLACDCEFVTTTTALDTTTTTISTTSTSVVSTTLPVTTTTLGAGGPLVWGMSRWGEAVWATP